MFHIWNLSNLAFVALCVDTVTRIIYKYYKTQKFHNSTPAFITMYAYMIISPPLVNYFCKHFNLALPLERFQIMAAILALSIIISLLLSYKSKTSRKKSLYFDIFTGYFYIIFTGIQSSVSLGTLIFTTSALMSVLTFFSAVYKYFDIDLINQ